MFLFLYFIHSFVSSFIFLNQASIVLGKLELSIAYQ